MNNFGHISTFPANGDVALKSSIPSDTAPFYFSFDQGSNSFDCSDFGWGEPGSKTPEISSILSSIMEESDDSLFLEDSNATKKIKLNSQDLVPHEDNAGKTLSDELSAFEMKHFQTQYLDGRWDASVDAFLDGDATQDNGNPVDLWSFDDLPAVVGGAF